MVKVSVLIPVYNAEKFIRESINSILNQTFNDFELLILNDASQDNSEQIIHLIKDKRLKYYKNASNLGISLSRNTLMKLAKGEYLAIMDNDDLSLPDRFEKQVKYLDEHPDVTIVGSWGRLFNHMPAPTLRDKIRKFIINMGWVWCQPEIVTMEETLRGNTCMHSSMMIRKKDFENNQIEYNQQYTPAEDYDVLRQALQAGLKIRNIQEVLFEYNLHGNNFSIRKKQAMKKADQCVKQNIRKFLNINDYHPYPYWLIIARKLRLKAFMPKQKTKDI